MNMIVLECLCGNSRTLLEQDLRQHPSALIACGGLVGEVYCQLQYEATELLRHADRRGIYWAKDHVEKKQATLEFSTGPS